MATMLNHTDGTGLSKERYNRLLECEECLLGLVDSVDECVKQISNAWPFVYPDPPDRYNIWTQMKYVVLNLKDMRTFVDETNVHDADYEEWSLPGRIRVLAQARNQAPTTATTGLTITKEEKDRLIEADRCLTGLVKPIDEAFRLAQGGTKYEPNAPEGEFDIWDIMKYVVAQLDGINKESEKSEFTNNALKSASLSDRVNLLIAENKSRDAYYQDYKNCLTLLQTEIAKAHTLVDGSGSFSGELEETKDPDIVSEMRYVANSITLVDEALNKYEVPTYKGASWTDLNLDHRVNAVAHSLELTGLNGVNGTGTHADVQGRLADQVLRALMTLDLDAPERQQSISSQMAKVNKDLNRMEEDLNKLVPTPNLEDSMANRLHRLANRGIVNEDAKPDDEDLVQHFKGIFEKLYDEIGNLKDEVFKEKVMELLRKVLPSGENPTKRPVDPRHGEIDPDV